MREHPFGLVNSSCSKNIFSKNVLPGSTVGTSIVGIAKSSSGYASSIIERIATFLQPGDVFVYAAGDHNLEGATHSKYGHAIMIVDVAVDEDGNKAFLLAEGNTPARDIHILRNWMNPFASPWFYLDADAKNLYFDCFYYKSDELRCFQ